MKCSLGISNFLAEISSLSHSIVFLYFLCIDLWGMLSYLFLLFFGILHSDGYIFPFLLCCLLLLSKLFYKASSDNHFAFMHFFFLGMVLILTPVQCHKLSSTVFQALCLADPILWIYLSLPLYNHKGFDLGHIWMVQWFSSTFVNVSLNLTIRRW